MKARPFRLVAIFTVALLAAPFAALGEQAAKVAHVGFLTTLSAADIPLWRDAFRQGLWDLGYREGQNIVIEYRYADGHPDRLPALASELIGIKMDVIAAESTPSSRVAEGADALLLSGRYVTGHFSETSPRFES